MKNKILRILKKEGITALKGNKRKVWRISREDLAELLAKYLEK